VSDTGSQHKAPALVICVSTLAREADPIKADQGYERGRAVREQRRGPGQPAPTDGSTVREPRSFRNPATAAGYRARVAPGRRPAPPGAASRRATPPALVAAVAGVGLEALVLLGVGTLYLVELVRSGTTDVVFAGLTVALAVAAGVGLAVCARGLARHRRWARAPVVTWQLLQSAAVAPALGGPFRPGAIALLAVAAVVVVALFTPAVVRATSGLEPPAVS